MTLAKQRGATFAAILLASLTLFVFYVLQHYGPESAVRLFSVAVAERNARKLQDVTLQNIENPDVVAKYTEVAGYQAQGLRPQVYRMWREPNTVTAEVAYLDAKGRYVRSNFWVIVKKDHNWKIDAVRTRREANKFLR